MSKSGETRNYIMQKSFDLIYQKGYQATSIDDIISTTNVTKGAFFYHFKSKEQMGLGLISELLYPNLYDKMIKPLENSTDPVTDLYKMMEMLLNDKGFFNVEYGCPAINLIEEMSPISNLFKTALSKLVSTWHDAIVSAVRSAQSTALVKPHVSPEEVAVMIISGYGGVRTLGKVMGRDAYKTYLSGLKSYLIKL
ncbi:TetR/AcrR family transcriptional regulator [Pedobacter psychroterrae]|uniref:TetR/AcrR family transcriptional regulator n=1 Tax=Pedobacter psychroterrae TaxID=2530453 RepID=A0A4R0NQ83_9SPHI|nr:TetR/AcrR family transcriptional regulator [Pedobacter psychroterrae]TCD03200.1 TetR/AcrR family transcriptional regulator [Pedobacter psychroterrae]